MIGEIFKSNGFGYYEVISYKNAYKVEKEIYVKELAQKYQNDIDERSYVALLNYKVDIND